MRIISGKYKGRRINTVMPPGVRPTTDSARETIFNILYNYMDFEDKRILDVFGGSGMLGFEALSRGASHCFYIEKNRKVAELLRQTAKSFKIPDEDYSIYNFDALKYLKKIPSIFPDLQFDIVFIDPPYRANVVNETIHLIAQNNLLVPGGFIAGEHTNYQHVVVPESLELITERNFGETIVMILQRPE